LKIKNAMIQNSKYSNSKYCIHFKINDHLDSHVISNVFLHLYIKSHFGSEFCNKLQLIVTVITWSLRIIALVSIILGSEFRNPKVSDP
jgi:hypothetical protein